MTHDVRRAKVRGSDIKVGDVLHLWFGKVRVVCLEPYTGPLAHLFPEGARIVGFDIGPGMTIDNSDYYETATF